MLDADEEFIVLDGALEIDGVAYGRHDYAHLPRGLRRTGLRSAGGAAGADLLLGRAAAPSRPTTRRYRPTILPASCAASTRGRWRR